MSGAGVLPHDIDAEASILGGILLRNDVLQDLAALEPDDFHDARHRVVFSAMRNLEAHAKPIDVVTIGAEIERQGKADAVGGEVFLGALCLRVPTSDNVVEYAGIVRGLARNRRAILAISDAWLRAQRWPHEAEELIPEIVGELEQIARGTGTGSARGRSARELLAAVYDRAHEPWVKLRIGDDVIAELRAGGFVVLMGSTGAGKTSFAGCAMVAHARHEGPAIAVSLELDGEEFIARIVGALCDESWDGTLRGHIRREHAERAIDPIDRLRILDGESATLAGLAREVARVRSMHPGEPVLVVVDYVQILPSKAVREVRERIAESIEALARFAKRERVLMLALSQSSRAGARALRTGDLLGAETADVGAESSAIERWAYLTLALGAVSPPAEDGTVSIDLSIGKARFGGGDRIIPCRLNPRTGRYRVTGDARSASDVKAERTAARDDQAVTRAALAIPTLLRQADAPMSRRDVRTKLGGKEASVRAAVDACLADVESGVVQCGPKKGGHWLLWTREKAEKAGAIIPPRELGAPQSEAAAS